MVGIKFVDKLTPHKLTVLCILIVSTFLIIHDTFWYVFWGTTKPFLFNILFHSIFYIPYVLCFFFENKFTKYFLVCAISLVAIMSMATFATNAISLLFIVSSIILIIFYGMKKTIIFIMLICQLVFSSIGEYIRAGTIQPIINLTFISVVLVFFLYALFDKTIDGRVKRDVEVYKKEIKIRDALLNDYVNVLNETVEKVEEGFLNGIKSS